MSEYITTTPSPAPPTALTNPPRRRGFPLIAWLVVLGIIGLILYRNTTRESKSTAEWLVPMQLQSRYMVGAANSGFPGVKKEDFYKQASKSLDQGSFSQRLRFAVLAGELSGPDEALRVLREIQSESSLSPSRASADAAAILTRLYSGYLGKQSPTPTIPESEQQTLRDGLGWFGDLALAPSGSDPAARSRTLAPARRTFFGAFSIALAALLGLLLGAFLWLLLGAFFFMGKLHSGVNAHTGNGGIYAETFALYMALFIGMSFLTRFLPESFEGLWISGIVMILSLSALVWPVLRGIPWSEVRHQLGLTCNNPLQEIAVGFGTYFSALPLLGIGLLIVLALLFAQRQFGLTNADGSSSAPSHPIISVALSGSWWVWLQMFIVACILAPLVEEIMFRGALYHHLREVRIGLPVWASVVFAALASAFVFAIIHPQGWLGVPILSALAVSFALSREWRGSLLPAMIAHGINNSISTLMLLMLAS